MANGVPKIPDAEALAKVSRPQLLQLLNAGVLGGPSKEVRQMVANVYRAKFTNFDEIAPLEFKLEWRFHELLRIALWREKALTRAEMERAFRFHVSGIGPPSIPAWIPMERLPFVELRSIKTEAGMESELFVFLTDTKEWVVDTEADAATIRAAMPDAKVVMQG